MFIDKLWSVYQTPITISKEKWHIAVNSPKTRAILREIKQSDSQWVCHSVDTSGIRDCLETTWKSKHRYYHINIHFKYLQNIIDLENHLKVLIHVLDTFCGKYDAYVDIIFTPSLKTYSFENNDLHVCNMNSGYCSFGLENTVSFGRLNRHILIYREEEWKKVLLHELIHYSDMHDYLSESKDKYRLYEAYTETMATILNVICKLKSQKRVYSRKGFENQLQMNLEKEFHHIQNIVDKIAYDSTKTNFVAYYPSKMYLLSGVTEGLQKMRLHKYIVQEKDTFRFTASMIEKLNTSMIRFLDHQKSKSRLSIKPTKISMKMTITKW